MAKIVSTKSELEALRGLMNADKSIAGYVLSSIDESYFNEKTSLEIYHKIIDAIHKEGEPPTVSHLINDPELSQDAVDFLSSGKDFKTKEEAEKSIAILNKYRQIRGLYVLAQTVSNDIEENAVKIDKIIESASDQLTKIRQTKGDDAQVLKFGQSNNSSALIKDVIFGEHNDDLIPTGFKIYDDVNGGWPRGGLVTLGGSTGAGKSTLSTSMGIAQAELGYRVVIVPLEMEESEMTARIIANVTGTELGLITQNKKMAEAERNAVYKKMGRWLKKVSQAGGCLAIYKPRGDVSLDDVFSVVNTYSPDIVYIDYISLLRGVDGDDQWLQLGRVARQAKVDAGHNHRVNVLLCQVNDEGKIRYARSISEHCITGDTLIDTDQGLIPIASLYPEAEAASTKYLSGIKAKSERGYSDIESVHYNGIREVYELTLENGMQIRATASHRFRFLDSNTLDVSWHKLNQLKAGQHIAIDNQESLFGKDTVVNTAQGRYAEKNILSKQVILDKLLEIAKQYDHNRFVKILSIKKVGEEKVYDLTIKDTHSYVANGFVVHNSNNSWTFVANQETKDQGIIKINQPKCRQGRAFPFTLKVDYSKMRVTDMPQDAVDSELSSIPTPAKRNLASDL